MKRLLVLTIVLSVAAPPIARAQAPDCACTVWFVGQYTRPDSNYYRQKTAHMMSNQGVDKGDRDGLKSTLYDWKRNNAFDEKFCKRYKRFCTAAKACIAAAAASIVKDEAQNQAQPDPRKDKSSQDIAIDAAVLCGAAAAGVYLGTS